MQWLATNPSTGALMLVKFSCGCVGLVGVQGDEEDRAVVLKPCDLPSEEAHQPIAVYRRDLSDKTTTPLEATKAVEVLDELSKLVNDGYRFRAVRSLLR